MKKIEEVHSQALTVIKDKIQNCQDKHFNEILQNYLKDYETYTESLKNRDGPVNIFFVGKSKTGKSTLLQHLTKRKIFPIAVCLESLGLWKLTVSTDKSEYIIDATPFPKSHSTDQDTQSISKKQYIENDEKSFLNRCRELTLSKINSDGSWDCGGQINLVTPESFCPHLKDFVVWDTPGVSEGRLKHRLLHTLHQNIITSYVVFLVTATSGTLETEENLFILSDFKTLKMTDKITFVITQMGEFIRNVSYDMNNTDSSETDMDDTDNIDMKNVLEEVNNKLEIAFINPIKTYYPKAEILVSEFNEKLGFTWDTVNFRFSLTEKEKATLNPSNKLLQIMKNKKDRGKEEYIEKIHCGLFKKLCVVIETLSDAERVSQKKADIENKIRIITLKQSKRFKLEMKKYLKKGILDDVTVILDDFDKNDMEKNRTNLSNYINAQIKNLDQFLPIVINNKFKKEAINATSGIVEEDLKKVPFQGLIVVLFNGCLHLGKINTATQALSIVGMGLSGAVMAFGITTAVAAGVLTAGIGTIIVSGVLVLIQGVIAVYTMVDWDREDIKKTLKSELRGQLCSNSSLLQLINTNIDNFMEIVKNLLIEDQIEKFFTKLSPEDLNREDDLESLVLETLKKLEVLKSK